MTEANEVAANAAAAAELLRHVHLVTPDRPRQVAALLTAATTLIEREVGQTQAGAVLLALIEATLEDWAPVPAGDAASIPG